MHEDVGSAGAVPPHLDQRMAGDEIAHQRRDIAPGRNAVVGGAGQNVNAADSRDMDDDFPIIRSAKREPRIPFV